MAVALTMSVSDNMIMRDHAEPPIGRRGWIASEAVAERTAILVDAYDIRCPSPAVPMRVLSGGNQQKAVLARELHRRPRLLVAAQPTRGLDVSATAFVYRQIAEHRVRGGATLLVSNDLDELLVASDRIAVISDGRIVGTVDAATADRTSIAMLMTAGRSATPAAP
jgi:simple sugar transport system ATP-binding protein